MEMDVTEYENDIGEGTAGPVNVEEEDGEDAFVDEHGTYRSRDGQGEVLLCYDKMINKMPAAEWIQAHLPSSINRISSGIQWVHVARPLNEERDKYHEIKDLKGLMLSWEQVVKSGRPISFQLILELARNHRATAGKWMFFAETGAKIDLLWQKIAISVVEDVSAPFDSAKVSTSPDERHVVCIYNYDFTNTDQVMQLEQAIRNVGIKCMLQYKPDVYTYLGVYKKNPWGLKPTIMKSDYNIISGTSIITSDVMQI